MPTISLNPIQCFRLYSWYEKQAKGVSHLKRMQRLHTVMDVERIERLFEDNEKTIDAFQADGKPVPKAALQALRHNDPARPIDLEAGDVDKIAVALDRKKKDLDAENAKGFDDAEDWRIWLPIFDAFAGVEGHKEASKSVPAHDPGNGAQAEDARP